MNIAIVAILVLHFRLQKVCLCAFHIYSYYQMRAPYIAMFALLFSFSILNINDKPCEMPGILHGTNASRVTVLE